MNFDLEYLHNLVLPVLGMLLTIPLYYLYKFGLTFSSRFESNTSVILGWTFSIMFYLVIFMIYVHINDYWVKDLFDFQFIIYNIEFKIIEVLGLFEIFVIVPVLVLTIPSRTRENSTIDLIKTYFKVILLELILLALFSGLIYL